MINLGCAEGAAEDDVGLGKRLIDIALLDDALARDVVLDLDLFVAEQHRIVKGSAPGCIASSGSMTTGSGSYSTTTARAASSARASVSAATAATASPIRRTFSARM